MLKISVIDTRSARRLIVEGKLIHPWTKELPAAWSRAQEDLQGRKLVIDLNQVTVISREAEDAIFDLMRQGAKFSCGCVFIKYVLRQLARRYRCQPQDV
jgi:hypothetical protein